jgi:hypothetical protein
MAKDLGISSIVASYQTTVVIALNGEYFASALILGILRVPRHRPFHMDPPGECVWPSPYISGAQHIFHLPFTCSTISI